MNPNPNSPLPAPGSPLPPGRPRALDETKRREICALVSAGCGLGGAARYVGCDASTIRREARRNPDFARELRHAHRDCELAPLNAMRKAASRHWRAAAWLLERSDVQRFGKVDPQTITLDQFEEYTSTLLQIVRQELEQGTLRTRVMYTIHQVRDHCQREMAAGRSPFPIPPRVTQLDESPSSPFAESERRTKEAKERAAEGEAAAQRYFAAEAARKVKPQ
jgi:hypothetical protein